MLNKFESDPLNYDILNRENGYILYINVTHLCNIDCPRCYLSPEQRRNPSRLSVDTLRKFLSFGSFIDRRNTIVWQGGELVTIGEEAFVSLLDAARAVMPNAYHSVVTNLFNLPHWLLNILKTQSDVSCESTFAMGKKMTLYGSEKKYLEKFSENLNRLYCEGVVCLVNVELNKETYDAGASKLVDYMIQSGGKYWELDVSCESQQFRLAPAYVNHYPVFPPALDYSMGAQFLMEILTTQWERLEKHDIVVEPLRSLLRGDIRTAFNAGESSTFFTLMPSGEVCTVPLFSDLPFTFMGNVNVASMDVISRSFIRNEQSQYEKSRLASCASCRHLALCKGGPHHLPLMDGSGECSGLKRMRDLCEIVANRSKLG